MDVQKVRLYDTVIEAWIVIESNVVLVVGEMLVTFDGIDTHTVYMYYRKGEEQMYKEFNIMVYCGINFK